MNKIRIGILGYGNLGKGVEIASLAAPDMELVGIFTRRDHIVTKSGVMSANINKLTEYKDKIDVLILCGGSATDLPEQGAMMLESYNTVDSFDTHAKIPDYFAKMDAVGKSSGKLGIISVGWDPGLFSMARMLFGVVLPNGDDYTFWGKGVSQGHGDAIRRIEGVVDAIQYTIPQDEALKCVRNGEGKGLTARDKHLRECYVVAADGADKERIRNEIINMPNYFADYNTVVNFISKEELHNDHCGMPHGGVVIRSGKTGVGNKHVMELSLKLDSNPEFTAGVLVAYARGVARMATEGRVGAMTVLDMPLSYISPKSSAELMKELL